MRGIAFTSGSRKWLYDCRRIPNSQTIGQFRALVGVSIYDMLKLISHIPLLEEACSKFNAARGDDDSVGLNGI